MFVSRLRCPLRDREVQRALGDPYRMHKGLCEGLDPEGQGLDGRLLFRVEDPSPPVVSVLVQTPFAPTWAPSPSNLLRSGELDAPKLLSPSLCAGQALRFRLRANPVVKRAGKRLGLVGTEALSAWLDRKLAPGARAVEVCVRDEGVVRAAQGRARAPMALRAARFDGVLVVEDPDALAGAVRAGLGPAKGLGFGLLSLAPAQG